MSEPKWEYLYKRIELPPQDSMEKLDESGDFGECKPVSIAATRWLDELGRQGWELIEVIRVSHMRTRDFVFKRPLKS
jgi:hypothetical protein